MGWGADVVGIVNGGLLASSVGMGRKGMVTPITAIGQKGRPCRLVPFMPFWDLSGKPQDRQTTSSTPNPGFDERQVVIATL